MSVRKYNEINLTKPNPFTVRPIKTEAKTNDLILDDPEMRLKAFVGFADMGSFEASKIISPMHLEPGWKWR